MASDEIRCFLVYSLSGSKLLEHKCTKGDTRNVRAAPQTSPRHAARPAAQCRALRVPGRAPARLAAHELRALPICHDVVVQRTRVHCQDLGVKRRCRGLAAAVWGALVIPGHAPNRSDFCYCPLAV